jgi:hypothetical protein
MINKLFMKKPMLKFPSILLGLALFSSSVLLTSCKDDEVKKEESEFEVPTTYSELSVEQNKANLEDNGVELVNNLTEFKNTAGIQSTISFSDVLNSAEFSGGRKDMNSNKAIFAIKKLASFAKNKKSGSDIFTGLRAQEGEPSSAQELFDELVGTYTYNKTTNTWDETATTGKIIFKFPSTKTGSTNNAEFVIYDYAGVVIPNVTIGDDYTGDLPTSLKADLKVDGTVQLSYTFAASYNNSGEPTSISTAITIGPFKLSFEAKNTTTVVSADYALTHSGKNLISFGAAANGNFTTGNLETSENPGDVATSASAYFQLLNIKFAGDVNIKALADGLEGSPPASQSVKLLNDNYKLSVFYADSKKLIARTEFYVATDGLDEYADVRLIFADGSKADLETYTDVGFQEIQDALEAFASDVEDDFNN